MSILTNGYKLDLYQEPKWIIYIGANS